MLASQDTTLGTGLDTQGPHLYNVYSLKIRCWSQ